MPANKNRGLGRGFDALIPTELVEEEFDPTAKTAPSGEKVSADEVRQVPVAAVTPNPHQPRQNFDETELAGMTASVKEYGILQPLVASESSPGKYQLIAGERRLRAAKAAGLATVPVIVRSFSEQQKMELALIENIQRHDLNPIEVATAYRKLIDQFNLKQDELAKRVGKSQPAVANTMRLLALPLEAKRALAAGTISEGHARTLLSLPNREKQLALLDMTIANGWSVRQTETAARDFKQTAATREQASAKTAKTNPLTEELAQYLGAKVSLRRMAKGGKLEIEFYSDEELTRLAQRIKGELD